MNTGVGRPQIGQWYLRWDKGELFQVTAQDEHTRTVELQTYDGDIDEVDAAAWATLPLSLAEPPEDWTGPVDDLETDDLGYSETQMTPEDWTLPLAPLRWAEESWEDTRDESERDPQGEGEPVEELTLDNPRARAQVE